MVVFQSTASNLVAGDTNHQQDVFVHDRSTGATERVSVDSSGTEEDSSSFSGRLSMDGQVVAFDSFSTNLVAGDTNFANDVFVHDRITGITERISVDSLGAQANGNSYAPTISSDGKVVVFYSNAEESVEPVRSVGAAEDDDATGRRITERTCARSSRRTSTCRRRRPRTENSRRRRRRR